MVIVTHDKPTLLAAFESAMASASDTVIKHVRRSGFTEMTIYGTERARLEMEREVATDGHRAEWTMGRRQIELAKALKKLPKLRKQAIGRMKRTAVEALTA